MMRFFLIALVCLLSVFPANAGETAERILVFAAASMRDVLQEAGKSYRGQGGGDVVFSFAASSVLAKQIAAGAPADLYLAADTRWADWLSGQGFGDGNGTIIAGNELVVARKAGAAAVDDPAMALAGKRFAMGDPAHVPAGRYAREALEYAGVWAEVRDRAVYGENVRVALEYLRTGAVDAAILYRSDIIAFKEISEVYRFSPASHERISYVAIAAKGSAQGRKFLDFLSGGQGREILLDHGFTPGGS